MTRARETVFAAFLRAVNVGGTGKLAMTDLRTICDAAGFENVTTYIQSGNVVFSARSTAPRVEATLEAALREKVGKPVKVHVRTPAELEAVVRNNPFPAAPPQQVLVLFVARAVTRRDLVAVEIPGREVLEAIGREIFVHFPDGMGRSKLRLPFAESGTGRNLNTVRKVLEFARAVSTPRRASSRSTPSTDSGRTASRRTVRRQRS